MPSAECDAEPRALFTAGAARSRDVVVGSRAGTRPLLSCLRCFFLSGFKTSPKNTPAVLVAAITPLLAAMQNGHMSSSRKKLSHRCSSGKEARERR
jgi:hypothetical protein